MLLGNRQETRGAWVSFKKQSLSKLPVLEVRKLSAQQLHQLEQAFNALRGQPLLPLPQMAVDPVRAQIDAAVAQALGLPDLTPLREQLAREPVISLQPLRQQRQSA